MARQVAPLLLASFFCAITSFASPLLEESSPLLTEEAKRKEEREARNYFESGEYGRAAELFKDLLGRGVGGVQRAHTQYNLGCAYLAEGRWDEALEEFRKLELEEGHSPQLGRRLFINLFINKGHALLKKASSGIDEEEALGGAEILERLASALKLLEEGRVACELAEQAEAEERLLEGCAQGDPSEELQLLRREIKREGARLLERRREVLASHLPLKEVLLTLQSRLESGCAVLARIAAFSEDDGEKRTVLKRFAKAQSRAKPLFTMLEERSREMTERALDRAQEERGRPFEGEEEARTIPEVRSAMRRQEEIRSACERFLHGLEEMELGLSLESFASEFGASLALKVLLWEEEGMDPLGLVLGEWYSARAQGSAPLKEEEAERHFMARLLAGARSQEGDPLERLLFGRLAERLEQSGSSPTLKELQETLYLYEQIHKDEAETLKRLRHDIERSLGDPLGWRGRIGALDERLQARATLSTEASGQERLSCVREVLGVADTLLAMPTFDERSQAELFLLIESALKAWSPSTWVYSHIEEWCDSISLALGDGPIEAAFSRETREEIDNLLDELSGDEERLGLRSVADKIRQAGERLGLTTGEVNLSHPAFAKIALEDGYRWLLRAKQELESKGDETPEALLKAGISEQTYSLALLGKLEKASAQEPLGAPLTQLLTGAQGFTLLAVADFPSALASKVGADGGGEDLLQDEPWAKVLALYYEGCEEAGEVASHIGLALPEWAQGRDRADLAIKKWKEALSLLDDPNDPGRNEKDGEGEDSGGGGDPEEESAQGEEGEVAATCAPSQLFEELLQMEQEDRPVREIKIPSKQGARPW